MLVSACRYGPGSAPRRFSRPALILALAVSCTGSPRSFFNDSSAGSGGSTAAGSGAAASAGGNQTTGATSNGGANGASSTTASGSGAATGAPASGSMSSSATSSGAGGLSGSGAADGGGEGTSGGSGSLGGSGGSADSGSTAGHGGGGGDTAGGGGETGTAGGGPDESVTRTFDAPEGQLGIVPDGGYGQENLLCVNFAVPAHAKANAIADVSVTIAVDMDFAADLVIFLESPEGTVVTLLNGRGGGSALSAAYPLTFADLGRSVADLSSTVALSQIVCTDGSDCVWHPDIGNFADLAGENATGLWSLCFGDTGVGDVATVVAAELTLRTLPQ